MAKVNLSVEELKAMLEAAEGEQVSLTVDDYSGEVMTGSGEIVTVSMDGETRELVLSRASKVKFEDAVAPFWVKARKVSGRANGNTSNDGTKKPQNNEERKALLDLGYSRLQLSAISEDLVKKGELTKLLPLSSGPANADAKKVREYIEETQPPVLEDDKVKKTPALRKLIEKQSSTVAAMQEARKTTPKQTAPAS